MLIKKKFRCLGLLILSFLFLYSGQFALARENVKDWYIKDFHTTVEIFNDDSAIFTENITADCGTASGKHGIFRVLPTRSNTPSGTIYTPVELISITDFRDVSYNYTTSMDSGTITFKIGSANKTVSGENNYRIKYKVKNVIRDQANIDEFYWNLSGNYWDMEIDNFTAMVILPDEITSISTNIVLYDGATNNKSNNLSSYSWISDNVLEVKSKQTLGINQGITMSLGFPKGIVNHQIINSEDENNENTLVSWIFNLKTLAFIVFCYFFLIPIIVFIIALTSYKRKQKKNPYYRKSIVTEFEPPEGISPIMLGFIDKSVLETKMITASIVRMAILQILLIEEKEKKILFSKTKYLVFKQTDNQKNYNELDEIEKYIFDFMFKDGKTTDSDKLRESLPYKLGEIQLRLDQSAKENGYILKKLNSLKRKFLIADIIFSLLTSFITSIVLTIFLVKTKNLSEKGQRLHWQIQGFKRYLTVAEKDRHSFYEEENIFTKLLPYSIAIGDVKKWVEKMKDIYGEEYINQSLYWYTGVSGLNALSNITNITNTINSISESISSSTGSDSGQSGGGSSGGGSGGGGGGGW